MVTFLGVSPEIWFSHTKTMVDLFYDNENKIPFKSLYRQLSGIDWDIDTGSRHNVCIFKWSDYSFCDKITSTE